MTNRWLSASEDEWEKDGEEEEAFRGEIASLKSTKWELKDFTGTDSSRPRLA